jgi:hypothetical protein
MDKIKYSENKCLNILKEVKLKNRIFKKKNNKKKQNRKNKKSNSSQISSGSNKAPGWFAKFNLF